MNIQNPGKFRVVRLTTWKQIASFVGRDERTVKRWEETRGLPVRRLPGNGRASVFAYEHELQAWLDGVYLGQHVLGTGLASPPTTGTATFTIPEALRAASDHVLSVILSAPSAV